MSYTGGAVALTNHAGTCKYRRCTGDYGTFTLMPGGRVTGRPAHRSLSLFSFHTTQGSSLAGHPAVIRSYHTPRQVSTLRFVFRSTTILTHPVPCVNPSPACFFGGLMRHRGASAQMSLRGRDHAVPVGIRLFDLVTTLHPRPGRCQPGASALVNPVQAPRRTGVSV